MLKEELIEYMKEYGLSRDQQNELIDDAILNNGPEELLELLGGRDFMKDLPKALAIYCFRNGPIEDMHAGYSPETAPEGTKPEDISQLSQEDMKILNKYMVDKLGFLLHLFMEGRYTEMAMLLEWPLLCSGGWDNPNIEKEETEWQELLADISGRKKG